MLTRVEEAVVPATPPVVTRLAVMPVVTEAGSEGIRPELTRAVVEALSAAFPEVTVLAPDEVARRLARSGAATGYARLVEDYERAGAVAPERVERVVAAVGAPHLLQLRGAYLRENFLDPWLFDDDLVREERQLLAVVARLWAVGEPGPVWEAVLRTRSETNEFATQARDRGDLLVQLAERLAAQVPLAPRRRSDRAAAPPALR